MECMHASELSFICLKEKVLAILPTRFGKSVIYSLIQEVPKTSIVDTAFISVAIIIIWLERFSIEFRKVIGFAFLSYTIGSKTPATFSSNH